VLRAFAYSGMLKTMPWAEPMPVTAPDTVPDRNDIAA
jgi:hypothetical protein